MQSISAVNFQAFCGANSRYEISAPFVADGYEWATDMRIGFGNNRESVR